MSRQCRTSIIMPGPVRIPLLLKKLASIVIQFFISNNFSQQFLSKSCEKFTTMPRQIWLEELSCSMGSRPTRMIQPIGCLGQSRLDYFRLESFEIAILFVCARARTASDMW